MIGHLGIRTHSLPNFTDSRVGIISAEVGCKCSNVVVFILDIFLFIFMYQSSDVCSAVFDPKDRHG